MLADAEHRMLTEEAWQQVSLPDRFRGELVDGELVMALRRYECRGSRLVAVDEVSGLAGIRADRPFRYRVLL